MYRSKRILLVSVISVIFILSSSSLPKAGEEGEPVLKAPASGKIGWIIPVTAKNLNPNGPCTFRYKHVYTSYECPGKGGKRLYTDSTGSVTGEIELPQVSYEHQGLGKLIVSAGPKTAVQEFTIEKTVLTWEGKAIIGHDIQISAHNLPPNLLCGFLWRGEEGGSRSNSKLTTDHNGHLQGAITLPIIPQKDQEREGTLYIESKYKSPGARLATSSLTFEKAILEVPAKGVIGHDIHISARNLPPNVSCKFLWRWGGVRPGWRSTSNLTTDSDGNLAGKIKLPIIPESDWGEGTLYLESGGRLASALLVIEEKAAQEAPKSYIAVMLNKVNSAIKQAADAMARFWAMMNSALQQLENSKAGFTPQVKPVAKPAPVAPSLEILSSGSPAASAPEVEPDTSKKQERAVQYSNSNNLASGSTSQPAVASSTISGYADIHKPEFINDGHYGNGSCWIGGSADSWIKIDLGAKKQFNRVQFGRDRTENGFSDRKPGQFIIYVADSDAVYADVNDENDDSEYRKIFDSSEHDFGGTIQSPQSVLVSFPAETAQFIKIQFTAYGAAIDEVEVWYEN